MHRPHLLFLDAYDSFSNNIISLLHQDLKATVEVIKIDDKRFATTNDACFHGFLKGFDGVVAGPGPGDPRNSHDLGLIGKLWHLPEDVCLPVLGICLGFQSLALAYGGTAERLPQPRHGLITEVVHRGTSLFQNIGVLKATQYHSLHARLGHETTDMASAELWKTTPSCPSLEPLAWDFSDSRNGPILMGLKHISRPFYGVQYHPESICTSIAGAQIISNWWTEAFSWTINQAMKKPEISTTPPSVTIDSRRSSSESGIDTRSNASSLLDADCIPSRDTALTAHSTPAVTRDSSRMGRAPRKTVTWKCIDVPASKVDVASLLQALQNFNENAVMLESGTKNGLPVRPETGRFSILGCVDNTQSIRYSTSNHLITSTLSGTESRHHGSMTDVWSSIETFMTANQAIDGPTDVPFWGGLTGFISYEAGLETLNVIPANNNDRPDVWFIFIQRSIVVDHVENKVYIQTLKREDEEWVKQTEETVFALVKKASSSTAKGIEVHDKEKKQRETATQSSTPDITVPSGEQYCNKVSVCQDHIRAGSSYELCLTDQSTVRYEGEGQPTSIEIYQRLRTMNPAPFGAYLRLKGEEGDDKNALTILSSSPERFLSWSRGGKCQFRPIKGTVKKTDGMTREKAEELLKCEKEQAENLMIVDLIRHDLHGVVGPGNVQVKKLMGTEEYQTVFQLVSVIEGQLPQGGKSSGIDVLAASLPPGSMTGAPKKRSCEILTEIEGGARGIYSGVLGYVDVGGGGDFAVVIRTAFKWNDEGAWRIGAGGAVTVLSSPLAEFQEMMTKRSSSLGAFRPR